MSTRLNYSTESSPAPTLVDERLSMEGERAHAQPVAMEANPKPSEPTNDVTTKRTEHASYPTSTNEKYDTTIPTRPCSHHGSEVGKKRDLEAANSPTFVNDDENARLDFEGEGTAEAPFVVDWLDTDLDNPMAWRPLKKWYITAVVATGTLVVAFGSSVFAGGIPQMMAYFEQRQTILTLGLTFYVLGFALGPLLWAPLSEMYGRRAILIPTYTLFTLFHIGCACARNIETLLICRFFAGFFGASPLTNSGGVVSDIFDSSERAVALSLFSTAPFAGPVLGPIVGGYMGMTVDWRYLFWLLTAFAGVLCVFGYTVPETYSPILLRRRAHALSKETGRHYVSTHDLKSDVNETLLHKLKVNTSRPFIFLLLEPIVLAMAIYAAVVYAVLYMMFPSFPIIFRGERQWNLGESGLPFIGVGVGILLGILVNIVIINPKYVRDLNANGGHLPPEARLPVCCLGGISLPIGLIIFAWTAQPSVHWIIPCLATIPFGFGMVIIFLSMMSYLVDCYMWYCASALAANAVIRSLCGATFPLFVKSSLSLILTPIPFVFYYYGARIRAHSKYAPEHLPTSKKMPADIAADIAEEDLQQREARMFDMRRIKTGDAVV